jgi:hypothetical protein
MVAVSAAGKMASVGKVAPLGLFVHTPANARAARLPAV